MRVKSNKRCPICKSFVRYFEWEDKGEIVETLEQCQKCNYMKHDAYGASDLTLGDWHSRITSATREDRAKKIKIAFARLIIKARKQHGKIN